VCSAGGELVVAGYGDSGHAAHLPPPVFYTQPGGVWTLDAHGEATLHLGDFPVAERVTMLGRSGGVGSGPHPFGRSISFALDEQRIVIGTGEALGVKVYDRRGRLISIMRAETEDLDLAPDIMSRYADAEIDPGAARIIRDLTENDVQGPERL